MCESGEDQRKRIEEWVAEQGGTLLEDDMILAWCHIDTRPSAKMYDNNRVHCFACNKTYFAPWARTKKIRSKTLTTAEYDLYRAIEDKINEWPLLQEAITWFDQENERILNATTRK